MTKKSRAKESTNRDHRIIDNSVQRIINAVRELDAVDRERIRHWSGERSPDEDDNPVWAALMDRVKQAQDILVQSRPRTLAGCLAMLDALLGEYGFGLGNIWSTSSRIDPWEIDLPPILESIRSVIWFEMNPEIKPKRRRAAQ